MILPTNKATLIFAVIRFEKPALNFKNNGRKVIIESAVPIPGATMAV